MRKPKMGELFWRLNTGNAARNREQRLEAVRVTHVGRKWFTVAPDDCPHRSDRFTIADRMQDSGDFSATATAALYASPQQWEDEKEFDRLWLCMASMFTTCKRNSHLDLDALRQIAKIAGVPDVAS